MFSKILIVLASASLIASATAPAYAGWYNGITPNGLSDNGRDLNGREMNGQFQNGQFQNGQFQNGTGPNGTERGAGRFAIDGIELPAQR